MKFVFKKTDLVVLLFLVLVVFMSALDIFYIIIPFIATMSIFLLNRDLYFKKIYHLYFKWFILPACIIFVHSIFTMVIKEESFYFFRSISNFVVSISIVICAFFFYCLKKDSIIKAIFDICVIKYLFNIISAINSIGISVFFREVAILGSESLTQWLEDHDIALTMGMFVIYFLFFEKRTLSNIIRIIISIVILMLSFKRIAIAALIIAILYYFALRIFKEHKKVVLLTSLIITTSCLLFVFLVKDGRLMQFLFEHGINPMGRNKLFAYFENYYEFNISFFGQGSGFTGKLLTQNAGTNTGVGNIVAIHSDILRTFIEYGFVGSILWYFYYPYFITKKINSFNKNKAVTLFLVATVYSYIIYSTDNTTSYFIFQLTYMLLPLTQIDFMDFEKVRLVF